MGPFVGVREGFCVGEAEDGLRDGPLVGEVEGLRVGAVGDEVGPFDGAVVLLEGFRVGETEGGVDGRRDGLLVGEVEGLRVGAVGDEVGPFDGAEVPDSTRRAVLSNQSKLCFNPQMLLSQFPCCNLREHHRFDRSSLDPLG